MPGLDDLLQRLREIDPDKIATLTVRTKPGTILWPSEKERLEVESLREKGWSDHFSKWEE
jgi:hypothetical protein